ncbi:hypothetical protein [Streptomyces sp. NBC_00687]|uniref:hypothetical protein n=1 Tax=Streptomyces sp. NBC_00687 TaxID=2975807 RepID=UPI00224D646B|nr:hypothetical protein [Streptomyces sp. NBC_00687]MCX4912867.1 hypothetical protein [Streptomyces sp. NBC_00687]
MIPEHPPSDDPGGLSRRILANEPAYYARKDRLYAGYLDAVENGREPTAEERHEARERRRTAAAQVFAAARFIVRRESARIHREGL